MRGGGYTAPNWGLSSIEGTINPEFGLDYLRMDFVYATTEFSVLFAGFALLPGSTSATNWTICVDSA